MGKDAAYEAVWHGAGAGSAWLVGLTVVASVLMGLAGLVAGVRPFHGTPPPSLRDVHEPAWPLWLPPLVLAATAVVAGVVPGILDAPLFRCGIRAVLGRQAYLSLAIWHGVSSALLLQCRDARWRRRP